METNFIVNKVYFIVSLNGMHLESANDLFKYHISKYFEQCEYIEVNSTDDLRLTLNKISSETSPDLCPLLHIEAHGLESGNGIHLNSGEQVLWDSLREEFTEINKNCCNNLTICLATCNSMKIIHELIQPFYDSIDAEVPFFCFVGSEYKVSIDTLINSFPIFYKIFSETRNINSAIIEMNKVEDSHFRFDFCYHVFRIIIDHFVNSWIKNRIKLIVEDTNRIATIYCPMYEYTYGKSCDISSINYILTSEQFYIDYLNKRQNDYLMVSRCGDTKYRFPKINKINNFEKSIPELRTIVH